jgi:hypothetical protein
MPPANFIDLSGRVFGLLTVIGRNPVSLKRHNAVFARWDCRCACGKTVAVLTNNLKTGHTQSCGCRQPEVARITNTTHGHTTHGKVSPEYQRWLRTLDRCYNPKNCGFHNYGGRNIHVFPLWRIAFQPYCDYLHSIGFSGAPGQSVDRIDNNGHYEPGNLRVTNHKGQMRNTRTNRLVTAFGQTLCVAEWAERTGINYATLYNRLYSYHWTPERALTP